MDPSHDWQLTADLHHFLSRAGDFLRSRPARHTVALTVTDLLSKRGPHVYGDEAPLFGYLADPDGGVRAALIHTLPHWISLSRLTDDGDADALAARLTELGHPVPGVSAESGTAAAFAEAWQRRSGTTARLHERHRLYRLSELAVPEPAPAGRARKAVAGDRELLTRWLVEFKEEIAGPAHQDPGAWADDRLAYGGATFWEDADGTAVSLAGTTRPIAGQVRIGPVYTPVHLRGRGYAGAVTAAASRAALAGGAREVLLFTNLANPTSNALYQRIGYREVTDFTVYAFGG